MSEHPFAVADATAAFDSFASPEHRVAAALRHLAESSVLAMAVFDSDMRYLAASPEWLRGYRLDLASIEGRSHYELFPEMPARWKDVHRRALAGETCRCELDLLVRSDGTSHWLRWSVSPWRDERGAIGGLVICSDDITESRRIHASLDAAESTIATLFETVAIGVAILDANGQYVRINPAFEHLLGYTQHELRQMCLGSTIHPDDLACEAAGLDALLHGRLHHRESRLRHLRADGEPIWVDQIETAMPNPLIGSVQLVVCVRDATERQAMEQRLRETDRLASVGMLGAGLGHDMKSVLFAMRCGLEAEDRIAGVLQHDGAAHAARRQIVDGIDYLDRLSQGLLAFVAEPDTHDDGPPERTDLIEWWRQSHPLLRRAVPRGVAIEMRVPESLPKVAMGTAALSQVMLNLVVNAGQAIAAHRDPIRRRGCVVIAPAEAPRAGHLRLSIVDEGVGMREEIRRRAFEAFFTTRSGVGGTGLGLAMVKRLVDAAGGAIEIDTELERGTTVHLDLPIAGA